MTLVARIALAWLATVGLVAAPASAEELTLSGKIVCAKCTLKKPDAQECQNVLVVKDDGGRDVEYYIAKNAVAVRYGDVCTSTKKVTVTGSVSDQGGRKWVLATAIEDQKAP
jgi:hypothetical protein